MKNKLHFSLLFTLSNVATASSTIDTVLLDIDPCALPIEDARSHQCSYQNKPFVYKKSIWENDNEAPDLVLNFWDGTRLASDKEWQQMDLNSKMLNQKRNECARRDEVSCIIFDND